MDILNVSRTRAQQLVARDDFPAPIDEIAAGRVWARDDVIAWAKSKNRTISDDEPA